ncbi:MAG: 8-oxo-dGTP diphosphatase, partial [Micromonosporaceae bacterium]|nr:8-oxo-dGTP diphosphatase [Micromonosporaceae bacterium]
MSIDEFPRGADTDPAGGLNQRSPAYLRVPAAVVTLTVDDELLKLLLVERGDEPDAGMLALPGGFMRYGEGLRAAAFCGETFTIRSLRSVFETVWDVPLDPGNFSRYVTKTEAFVYTRQTC